MNKESDNVSGIGSIDTSSKGVYIWLDNDCMVDSNKVGSWRLRTIIPNQKSIPSGLDVDGYTTYETSEKLDYIEGYVKTNGSYSYVKSRSVDTDCSEESCVGSFRFCGQDLLESNGWKAVNSSNSDIINTIIGGMQTVATSWLKVGTFDTAIQNNIYTIDNANYEILLQTNDRSKVRTH